MHMLQDRDVRIRRDRDCEWCGEVVEKATLCRYRVYVNEDEDFCVGYQHPECYTALLFAPYYLADSWERGSFCRGTSESR